MMETIAQKLGFIAVLLAVFPLAGFVGIYAILVDTDSLITSQLILLAIQVFCMVLVIKYPNETIKF